MPSEICAPPRAVRRVIHSATKRPPSIDLYEITPPDHHKLRVVSSELYSVWVHQAGRRPVPCFGESDHECQYHRLPLKQQHYLFVEVPDNPTLRLVRLTSGLVYQVLPELTDPTRNLNGVMLELWRENPKKADSVLLGIVLKDECVENVVRETPDIAWAVQRMLTAPDRFSPWLRHRATPRPRPAMTTEAGFFPKTSESKDLFTRALDAAKRGDTTGATALLKLAEVANQGEAKPS